MELAADLSTKTFLNTLKRFAARRGLPENIYSDNATNFTGASNELSKFRKWVCTVAKEGEIRDFLLQNEIRWHFIPPRSPHMGGLWEAAVKSAKGQLVKVVGNAHLTYEQLYTVLCQIEGILNSRPLTALSTDPNDCTPLTPAHFLVGDSLVTIPEKYPEDAPTNRLKLYERLQSIVRHFWKRWSAEYLTSIQQRGKWKTDTPNIYQVGALVILKEENLPVSQWRLGRIVAVHPGDDNIVRVVSVRTTSGVFKRSVVKVCVLPIETTQ